MPDLYDACHVIAVTALVGILIAIIVEGPPVDIYPIALKNQLFIAFVASFLSMGVALVAIYYKDYLDNRPPLEFKFELKQRDEDKNVIFVFCYKNNIEDS